MQVVAAVALVVVMIGYIQTASDAYFNVVATSCTSQWGRHPRVSSRGLFSAIPKIMFATYS